MLYAKWRHRYFKGEEYPEKRWWECYAGSLVSEMATESASNKDIHQMFGITSITHKTREARLRWHHCHIQWTQAGSCIRSIVNRPAEILGPYIRIPQQRKTGETQDDVKQRKTSTQVERKNSVHVADPCWENNSLRESDKDSYSDINGTNCCQPWVTVNIIQTLYVCCL